MYDFLDLQKWALILFVRESAQYYPTPYCCIPCYTHIFAMLERLENTNQDTVRKAVETRYNYNKVRCTSKIALQESTLFKHKCYG